MSLYEEIETSERKGYIYKSKISNYTVGRGFARGRNAMYFEEFEKPWMIADREKRASYFATETHLADAALVIENRKLWISRQMLAWFSPKFERIFYGNCGFVKAESSAENPPTYELDGKKYNDILELISVLFPCPKEKEVDWKNVEILLDLSTEYDICSVKLRCENFLKFQLGRLEKLVGQATSWKIARKNETNLLRVFSMAAKFKFYHMITQLTPLSARLSDAAIKANSRQIYPKALSALYQAKLTKTRVCFVVHKLCGPNIFNNRAAACSYCTVEATRLCVFCNRYVCKNCVQLQPCRCKFCSKPFTSFEMTDCSCGYQFDFTLFRD